MLSVAVPLAIVGEVMSHQDNIASLIHDAVLSRGSVARIKQLPLPLTAAEGSGTWMIMLHRVPNRLDVNAILHQAGMPMTATLIIIQPPIALQGIISCSCCFAICPWALLRLSS